MPPEQSPCKACEKHPCDEPKHCEARWAYVQRLGGPQQQAVDCNQEYKLLPR